MKPKFNYGIYIDHQHAFVVALNHLHQEHFISEEVVDSPGSSGKVKRISQQEHAQNKAHENMTRLVRAVVDKLTTVSGLLVFGPAQAKYDLQNEIEGTVRLKEIKLDVMASDVMDEKAAVRFVKDHFSMIKVGHQAFTAAKK